MENYKKTKKALNEVSLVDLSLIDKSTFNPRKKFDEAALDELSESIKQQGLLQPIKIRPITGTNRYEIVFGELYMSCIAGNARKQSNGQFFTPAHICDLMAELCGSQDNSVELCGDPACGSGRNLLAWHVKHLSSYLCAEDIDRTCCLMTVCNFLIHGCVGEVIWHDSLNPNTYYDGWKVNERLAIAGLPTIRRIAKEESVVWQAWQNQRRDAKGHVITPIKKINIRKKREEAKRLQLDLFD